MEKEKKYPAVGTAYLITIGLVALGICHINEIETNKSPFPKDINKVNAAECKKNIRSIAYAKGKYQIPQIETINILNAPAFNQNTVIDSTYNLPAITLTNPRIVIGDAYGTNEETIGILFEETINENSFQYSPVELEKYKIMFWQTGKLANIPYDPNSKHHYFNFSYQSMLPDNDFSLYTNTRLLKENHGQINSNNLYFEFKLPKNNKQETVFVPITAVNQKDVIKNTKELSDVKNIKTALNSDFFQDKDCSQIIQIGKVDLSSQILAPKETSILKKFTERFFK